jgi:hypothetical protein
LHCGSNSAPVLYTVYTYILTVYRALSGNISLFLNGLDNIINSFSKPESKFIIFGDFNIDYSTDNEKKRQLEAMLQTYNLSSIVHFPTRIQTQSKTLIDNIFIDIHKIINYTVGPLYSELSDHDAQLLRVVSVNPQILNCYTNNIRNKQIYYRRLCN